MCFQICEHCLQDLRPKLTLGKNNCPPPLKFAPQGFSFSSSHPSDPLYSQKGGGSGVPPTHKTLDSPLSIVLLQKGNGLQTRSDMLQWATVTDVSEACMVVPDSCGAGGGSFALWVRLEQHCSTASPGILTSAVKDYLATGFVLRCRNQSGNDNFRWVLFRF